MTSARFYVIRTCLLFICIASVATLLAAASNRSLRCRVGAPCHEEGGIGEARPPCSDVHKHPLLRRRLVASSGDTAGSPAAKNALPPTGSSAFLAGLTAKMRSFSSNVTSNATEEKKNYTLQALPPPPPKPLPPAKPAQPPAAANQPPSSASTVKAPLHAASQAAAYQYSSLEQAQAKFASLLQQQPASEPLLLPAPEAPVPYKAQPSATTTVTPMGTQAGGYTTYNVEQTQTIPVSALLGPAAGTAAAGACDGSRVSFLPRGCSSHANLL